VAALAPEKSVHTIKLAMGAIRLKLDEKEAEPKAPAFAPAGQSTQMIVGADSSDDKRILSTAETLYGSYKLKRVYYSAFSPIPDSPKTVPLAPPPLLREHRLYQADFLLRGYGFQVRELLPQDGSLALDIDPKLAWALANREQFPLDLNRADLSMIMRVPGIGLRSAQRIVELRRMRRVRYEDLLRLRCSMKKAAPFIVTADYKPARDSTPSEALRRAMADTQQQMPLWPELAAA
jgi:predicted DNA-binding helix-hairpin-helix protein